jgi:hypothetical protein
VKTAKYCEIDFVQPTARLSLTPGSRRKRRNEGDEKMRVCAEVPERRSPYLSGPARVTLGLFDGVIPTLASFP